MSFDEYEDAFIWRCDGCGLTVEFPPTNFYGALAGLKARGWRVSRDDSETEGRAWLHHCGKCRRKANEGLLDRRPKIVK